jgi:ABC-2 type transport system permease protein
MPIHDVGYRHWERAGGSLLSRWTVIAGAGMRLVWKNHWLRRMLILAWLPAAGLGLAVFAYEQSFEHRALQDEMPLLLGQLSESDRATASWVLAMAESTEAVRPLMDSVSLIRSKDTPGVLGALSHLMIDRKVKAGSKEAHAIARHHVWSLLLLTFFRYPQAVLMVLLVGMIAPPLISQDFRSRAFLLYFSRPITPLEYVWGKAIVIWGYLAAVTTLPALVMYVVGVLLSPSISVVCDTWDIPLRVLAASGVLLIPTTSLALFFSSLTTESRYAGFSWFAVWGLGWAAYANLEALRMGRQWSMISLYHVLGHVQTWVFGLSTDLNEVTASATLLLVVTILPLIVLLTRVAAPMRV